MEAFYDYVKEKKEDGTEIDVAGWRIFDIEDDGTIVLISAGNPEAYYIKGTQKPYPDEYVLTGNVNSQWSVSDNEISKYQIRDWSAYENKAQFAIENSATILKKSTLDSWYRKHIGVVNANTNNESTFKKIYQKGYYKYQNIIDNHTHYWLSEAINERYINFFYPETVGGGGALGTSYDNCAFGIRVLVSLSSEVISKLIYVGDKTLTGGNMDEYGGDQTYKVWDIEPKGTNILVYNANVPEGTVVTNLPDPLQQTWQEGEYVQISTSEPIRDGYKFIGWNTDKNATESIYYPGQVIVGKEGDFTLYAVWTEEKTLPSESDTTPYLPDDYVCIEDNLDTGVVIEDKDGNQYVWIEVPRTTTVYPTSGLNITQFTTTDYTNIEKDLLSYTSNYKSIYEDVYTSKEGTGLSEKEYYELKNKMLKSVYQNGGFYIGRYETGIKDAFRNSNNESVTNYKAVIQQNAYPYTYITCSQAQSLASGFAKGVDGYTSSLMFGVQWNLVIKHIETKEIESGRNTTTVQNELKSSVPSWGNSLKNSYTIYPEGQYYSKNRGLSYEPIITTFKKDSGKNILLTTGASSNFCKMGIYDFSGNVDEWTLQRGATLNPCVLRGGDFSDDQALTVGAVTKTGNGGPSIGFRVTLY